MKLFGSGEQKSAQEQPANPHFTLMIRVLAVGYLGYCLWEILKLYRAGGEDAPSLPLLIVAVVVLGGGAVWVAITSFLQWKKDQAAASAAADAEDAAAEQTPDRENT